MMSSTSTSILDSKPFSALANPFAFDTKVPAPNPQTDHKGVGLALLDSLVEDQNADPNSLSSKQKRKLVVFGSQLKLQIPNPAPVPNSSLLPSNSPNSPHEFGIKTPRSNLLASGRVNCEIELEGSSGGFLENLSVEEMELSEDYTCVIYHGPNPKTTRIFGNCVVERCCGVAGSPVGRKSGNLSRLGSSCSSSSEENFLSFCQHCKKELGQDKDIYMYRGEKAFCSEECRREGMLFDGVEN